MSTPDYSRPVFDPEIAKRLQKPARGSKVLAKERADAEESAEEIQAKKEAKARDGHCRFPDKHKCRGGLEGAHIVDKSRGGPNIASNIVSVCAWIHRRGPLSIHGKDYVYVPLTKQGANGPLAVYLRTWHEGRRGESSTKLLAKERVIHVWERA